MEKNNAENTEKSKVLGEIYDWIEVFAVSIAVVVIMLMFVFRLVTVDGHSMDNTLNDRQVLISSGLFYTPQDEDIIVLQQSGSVFEGPLVKRIIATGGETLKIRFTSASSLEVYVNGEKREEAYAVYNNQPDAGSIHANEFRSYYADFYTVTSDGGYEMTVPEGYVFVMGDNRLHSSDSRTPYVGFVREDDIIGKVIFRLTPVNQIGTVK